MLCGCPSSGSLPPSPLHSTPYSLLLLRRLCSSPSGLTAYDSSSTGRISRLGVECAWSRSCCCCIGTDPIICLFSLYERSPGRLRHVAIFGLLGAATCSCTAALLWAVCRCCSGQVWDSGAVLQQFLLLTSGGLWWFLFLHWWSVEGRKLRDSSFVFHQDEVHEAWIESGYLSGWWEWNQVIDRFFCLFFSLFLYCCLSILIRGSEFLDFLPLSLLNNISILGVLSSPWHSGFMLDQFILWKYIYLPWSHTVSTWTCRTHKNFPTFRPLECSCYLTVRSGMTSCCRFFVIYLSVLVESTQIFLYRLAWCMSNVVYFSLS